MDLNIADDKIVPKTVHAAENQSHQTMPLGTLIFGFHEVD